MELILDQLLNSQIQIPEALRRTAEKAVHPSLAQILFRCAEISENYEGEIKSLTERVVQLEEADDYKDDYRQSERKCGLLEADNGKLQRRLRDAEDRISQLSENP